MSTHSVPIVDSPTEGISGLLGTVTSAIRAPTSVSINGSSVDYTFAVDLTAGEVTTFASCVRTARAKFFSRSDWTAIEPDVDGLRQYVALASPTAAQTAQAVKALCRVLRTLFRD
jgi:hypothetical protein